MHFCKLDPRENDKKKSVWLWRSHLIFVCSIFFPVHKIFLSIPVAAAAISKVRRIVLESTDKIPQLHRDTLLSLTFFCLAFLFLPDHSHFLRTWGKKFLYIELLFWRAHLKKSDARIVLNLFKTWKFSYIHFYLQISGLWIESKNFNSFSVRKE